MAPRCYPFYFPLVDRRDHPPRIHTVRDGAAFAALRPAISGRYAPGRPLFSVRHPEWELTLDHFDKEDLIVMPTRPALDDKRSRKTILTSGGRLEVACFEAIRPFFAVLARDRVTLARNLAAQLPDGYRNRADIWFHQHRRGDDNVGARYAWCRDPYADRGQRRRSAPIDRAATAAFVVMTRLRAGGPTLLAAFALDGETTLAWCHLLALNYPYLVDGERFVMAELIADPMPERPPDLSFVERWPVRILIEHRLGGGSQRAA